MNISEISKFLDLPISTIITLASGYIGYCVANAGIKDHHKPIDIIFTVLVYGMFGSIAFNTTFLISQNTFDSKINILLGCFNALLITVLIATLWRKFIRNFVTWLLRAVRISYIDNIPSAWISLKDNVKYADTQLYVYLKNGNILLSESVQKFNNMQYGPFMLGGKGDVLMYVTHEKINNKWVERDEISVNGWGTEITYIPAPEIVRIDIRRKKI